MKSKKKLLLMGVGVMGALAMGVGATSTFAWYQATANYNAKSAVFTKETLGTGQTAVTATTLYLKLNAAPADDVLLSTKDGYSYAYSGNTLLDGTGYTYADCYKAINITKVGIYTNKACTADATSDQIGMIPAAGAPFTFTIKGGLRTRLSFVEPSGQGTTSGQFGAVFNTIGDASVKTIYGTLSNTGTVSLYSDSTRETPLTLYYSIAGQLSVAGDIYDNSDPENITGVEGITAANQDMTKAQVEASSNIQKDAESAADQELTLAGDAE